MPPMKFFTSGGIEREKRKIGKNYTVTNNSSTQEEEVKVETHFFFLGDFAQ
jgi:hypothetical protein